MTKETVENEIEWVEVPYGDDLAVTAQNLLGAAARLDLPPFVIKSTTRGVFLVPAEVVHEAESYSDGDDEVDEGPKSIDEYSKSELDGFAKDNDIDLTGHKQSNKAKAARIKEVLAEREAAQKAEDEANAKVADESDDTPPQDDDSTDADAKTDETQE